MAKRNPCFEDVTGLERLTAGDYCHKRGLLAYSTNKRKGILLRDVKSGEERVLHATSIGESGPVFSPEGDRIAFLAVCPGSGRHIFVYNLATGETTQVTTRPGVVMDPVWAPDGKKIAFARIVDNSTAAQKNEPIVVEDFGYKFDGRGYIKLDEHMSLYVVDLEAKNEWCVADGACDYLHHAWLPDSSNLACASDRFRDKGEETAYDLLKINIETGEMTRLSENLVLVSYPNPIRPMPTPDGKWIIAGILDPKYGMADEIYPEVWLYRFATDGSTAPERIFFGDDNCYQCVQFPYNACGGWGLDKAQLSEDGKTVYFCSAVQGQCAVFKLDLEGNGHAKLLCGGKAVHHGLGRVQDGKMLVSKVTTTVPEAYYLMDCVSGELETLLYQSEEEFIQNVEIQPTEDFFTTCLDDPDERIHGYVIPPYGKKAGEKYPVILYIHGGPAPFYTYGLTLEHHAFAAEGFGVIFCNPRGGSGYGWKHNNFTGADCDRVATFDLLQFVQECARRYDWMDEDRVGVTGGSYGGYMTNYLAAHTKRFKAYVTQRSVSNYMICAASSDMHTSSKKYESYGEFMMQQLRSSPIAHVENIDRPLLILHGCDDLRCPVEGAHQLFTAVKDIHPDLPVKMLLFPHTNHGQPDDPGQAKIYYQAMVDWFRAYL